MSIGTRGRYKGKPNPCGSGTITFPLFADEKGAFAILKKLVAARHILDSLDTHVAVYLIFGYRDQCNLELTPEMMTSLAELRCPVGITCFEDDEDGHGQERNPVEE